MHGPGRGKSSQMGLSGLRVGREPPVNQVVFSMEGWGSPTRSERESWGNLSVSVRQVDLLTPSVARPCIHRSRAPPHSGAS